MADETRQPQPKPPLGPLNRGIRDRLRRLSVGHVLTVYDLAALHDLLDMEALPQANEPRAIVRAFALAMERKLAANDATKGGWKKAHWFTLYRCMVMEKAELLNALEALDSVLAKLAAFDDRFEGGELLSRIDADEDELLRQLDTAKRDVLQEAADVSNYAMMIADVCGALPATDERGR